MFLEAKVLQFPSQSHLNHLLLLQQNYSNLLTSNSEQSPHHHRIPSNYFVLEKEPFHLRGNPHYELLNHHCLVRFGHHSHSEPMLNHRLGLWN